MLLLAVGRLHPAVEVTCDAAAYWSEIMISHSGYVGTWCCGVRHPS